MTKHVTNKRLNIQSNQRHDTNNTAKWQKKHKKGKRRKLNCTINRGHGAFRCVKKNNAKWENGSTAVITQEGRCQLDWANVRALTFYLRIAVGFMALSQPKHKSYHNLPGLSPTKVRPCTTVDFGFKASSLPTQNFLKLETSQPWINWNGLFLFGAVIEIVNEMHDVNVDIQRWTMQLRMISTGWIKSLFSVIFG